MWKRRLKIIILSIIVLILLFWLTNIIFVELSTSTESIETSEASISVMTYNLHGYDPINGLEPAINRIVQTNPDVLVLQEVFAVPFQGQIRNPITIISQRLNMTHYGSLTGKVSNPSGVSILSKFPIIAEYQVTLPSYDIYTKYLVVVTISTPNGNLNIMGTHLELPYYLKIQSQQAKTIIEEINKQDDLIFMCDCNSPDIIVEPVYYQFATYLEDAWIADGHPSWTGNTWPADSPKLRVDYIWFKGDVVIVKNSVNLVGTESDSDHLGIVAQIVI